MVLLKFVLVTVELNNGNLYQGCGKVYDPTPTPKISRIPTPTPASKISRIFTLIHDADSLHRFPDKSNSIMQNTICLKLGWPHFCSHE